MNGWRILVGRSGIIDWGYQPVGTITAATAAVFRAYSPVSEVEPDEAEHRRKLANAVNSIRAGKLNALAGLTLTANAATSTFTDARISAQSFLNFMPQTANAVAALAGMYVDPTTQKTGQAVITHANNAQTDRTFTVLIIG